MTKKAHLNSIIHELISFLAGPTNIAYLQQNGVSIWAGSTTGAVLRGQMQTLA